MLRSALELTVPKLYANIHSRDSTVFNVAGVAGAGRRSFLFSRANHPARESGSSEWIRGGTPSVGQSSPSADCHRFFAQKRTSLRCLGETPGGRLHFRPARHLLPAGRTPERAFLCPRHDSSRHAQRRAPCAAHPTSSRFSIMNPNGKRSSGFPLPMILIFSLPLPTAASCGKRRAFHRFRLRRVQSCRHPVFAAPRNPDPISLLSPTPNSACFHSRVGRVISSTYS